MTKRQASHISVLDFADFDDFDPFPLRDDADAPIVAQLGADELLAPPDHPTLFGRVSTAAALRGRVVGLLFGSASSPPFRGFAPKLAEHCAVLAARGHELDVVLVASDRDLAWPFMEGEAAGVYNFEGDPGDWTLGFPTALELSAAGASNTTDGPPKFALRVGTCAGRMSCSCFSTSLTWMWQW